MDDRLIAALRPIMKPFNVIAGAILRSRLHGLLSSNTMLLEFEGRRSDRALKTPVSYNIQNDSVRCFTVKKFIWWKNLLDENPVHMTIRGKRHKGVPTVIIDDPERMLPAMTDFFIAVPRDRRGAGIGLDEDGRPRKSDVSKIIPDMVYINIPLVT